MSRYNEVGKHATKVGRDGDYRYVQYHATKVVEWSDDVIFLNTGGWETPTTKTRMNQAARQFLLGYYIYQKDGIFHALFKDEDLPFVEHRLVLVRGAEPLYPSYCEDDVFLGDYQGEYVRSLFYCTKYNLLVARGDGEESSDTPDAIGWATSTYMPLRKAKELAIYQNLVVDPEWGKKIRVRKDKPAKEIVDTQLFLNLGE